MNKLVLGTVQFGLKYGINNKLGKPTREKSIEMLDRAYEKRIICFDTAAAYGDAEEILGQFISTRNLNEKVKIISKLLPNIIPEGCVNITDLVKHEIKKSLAKIKIDYLDGYLLHTPGYIYNNDIMEALRICKDEGIIKHFGVSIYEEKDALYAASLEGVEYIQVPYSVFDQRLNRTDFFKIAKKNNITVFGRSTFLQGLVFMSEKEVPEHLSEARDYLKELDDIIAKYKLTRLEISFLFSYKKINLDYLVFGVDTLEQLNQDFEIAEKVIECGKCIEELNTKFTDIKKSIIFPSLWSKPAKK